MMISRSANFDSFGEMAEVFYPDPADRQVLYAMLQPFFDYTDPITYGPYIMKDPAKFGVPKKSFLYQEGIGDAQVPNFATRMMIRSMGVPALKPLFEPVYGIEEKAGPIEGSAYVQFGPKPDPYPEEANVPSKKNPQHEAVRRQTSAKKQIEAFFKLGGKIEQFCEGSCDPN